MMKKIGGFIKKHKKGVIIISVILIIVIVIAVLVHRTKKKAEEMLSGMTQETFVLEKRNLVKSVSGTGKITSAEKKSIVVATLNNTKISTVNVALGDEVKAGDVLCTFDTEDIEKSLADARTDLAISQKKTANNMENEGRNLYNTQLDAVLDTNRNLEKLDKAQRIYDTELGEEAEASRIYDRVEDVYEDYWDEDEYYDLQRQLMETDNDAEKLAIEEKLAKLEKAKSNLSSAKSGTDSAHNAANSAEDNLETAKEVQADEYRKDVSGVKNAENNYENAKLDSSVASRSFEDNVKKYEEMLEDATVRSPFAGVVTAINYEAGDTYGGQALITVEDLSSYIIEADIDEYDISKVVVGQKVTFKTNATGDEELEAEVTEIAPRATSIAASTGSSSAATSTTSTAAYRVKMLIKSDCKDLRLDMTAKINIIVDSADDVYAVPISAVQTDESGNKYIEVEDADADPDAAIENADDKKAAMEAAMNAAAGNAPTKQIYVTTGVETDYYVEVSAPELTDGMTVIVAGGAGSGLDDMMMMMGPMGGM